MNNINSFINFLKNIKGFSDKTVEIYVKYVEILNKNDDSYLKVLSSVMSNNSNNTKRVALSAFKCYYKFINDDRASEITLPKVTSKVLPYITYDQYIELLSKIKKKSQKQFMKYIIIRLLFETGIRASELLSIKRHHIIDNKIIINGKGNSQRVINLSNNLVEELNEYIIKFAKNKIFDFSYKNLYKKIKDLNKEVKMTPHMFRRGYAKFCYAKGISIYDISLSMGHNDINTTASYIRKKSEDVDISHIF